MPDSTSVHDGIAGGLAASLARTSSLDEPAAAALGTSFDLLFQAAPFGACISTLADGRIVDANAALLTMIGWSREETIGRTSIELGVWADAGARGEVLGSLLADGPPRRREVHVRMKSGRERIGLVSGQPLDIGGAPHVLWLIEDITDRRRTEAALESILRRTSGRLGREFLRSLLLETTSVLGVRYGIVSQLLPGTDERVRTLASVADGQVTGDIEYDLAGTPCQHVVGQSPCVHVSGIRETFPEDRILVDLGAESYAGVPLFSASGRPLGLLAVLDTRPMPDGHAVAALLGVFAVRVAAELERMDAEAALRESEERYRSVVSAMGEGVLIYDHDGVIVDCNDAACRILRLSRDQVLGREPVPLDRWPIHEDGTPRSPDDRPSLRALRTGQPQRGVVIGVRRPDGVTWTTNNAVPLVRDGAERPDGVVLSFADITPLETALESLRSSEARYRSVVACLREGILIFDAAGRVVDCNESAQRILGLPRDQILGLRGFPPTWRVLHEDGTPFSNDERPSLHAARDGQPRHDVTIGIEREGRITWTINNAQPLTLGSEDGIAGVVVSFSDVTDRREAEDARRRAEQQLQQAQKLEAIGTFAGGIAHDFNNVLTAILGNAELARMDLEPGHRAARHLEQARVAGARGRQLAQRILAFTRRREVTRAPLHLLPVVREAFDLMRSVLPATIELVLDAGPDDPVVMADEMSVHQVMVNLCTNAAHALRDRRGRITVAHEVTTPDAGLRARHPDLGPGPHVRLSVADTGCGMDAATLERIFEPFFTTKAPGEGTGLGLSVVRRIVATHGGVIVVDSRPGEGARFDVYLPVAESAETRVTGGTQPSALTRSGRVLLVDDEPMLVRLCTMLLERAGFRVEGFHRAAEALAALRARPDAYDIVLTDGTMPGMTGGELATEVRKFRADLPVVLTSGDETLLSAEARREHGVAGFLPKPFTLEELRAALSAHL